MTIHYQVIQRKTHKENKNHRSFHSDWLILIDINGGMTENRKSIKNQFCIRQIEQPSTNIPNSSRET